MNAPAVSFHPLSLHSIKLRVLSVPLRRPIVSNPTVGQYTHWPFILVGAADLYMPDLMRIGGVPVSCDAPLLQALRA